MMQSGVEKKNWKKDVEFFKNPLICYKVIVKILYIYIDE